MENRMQETLRGDEQMAAENWRKRRWLTREETRTRPGSPSFRATKKRQRGRPRKSERPFDLCEAAEQFCVDCRRATNGEYIDHPKLSTVVDAVMQSNHFERKGTEEMLFVKTSDGLTKVVFSTVNSTDQMPIRKASVVGDRTCMTPSNNIPIATPVTDAFREKREDKRETEQILASRVICPGRPPRLPTPIAMSPASPPSRIAVESRVIGKNGSVFEHSLPSCSMVEQHHGRLDRSFSPASSLHCLSRPMPLARQGSGPHDVQFAYLPPFTPNKLGPAVSFRVKSEEQPIHKSQSFQKILGSFPILDPLMLLSRGFLLNGKQPVYSMPCPTETDCSMLILPSVSESLKEGVQPHIPAMKHTQQHCHSRDSALALIEMLERIKKGSNGSNGKGSMMLKIQNGRV